MTKRIDVVMLISAYRIVVREFSPLTFRFWNWEKERILKTSDKQRLMLHYHVSSPDHRKARVDDAVRPPVELYQEISGRMVCYCGGDRPSLDGGSERIDIALFFWSS